MCADIKPDNPIPLYQQIETSLRRRIAEGELTPNAMLPSRRELAREFGVALPTIERAISVLLADGTLRADDRRGTFVADAVPHHKPFKPRDTSVPVIGVITSLKTNGPDAELYAEWTTAIVASLEQAVHAEHGKVRCIDRSRASGDGLAIECAITRLRGEGVQALALVNENRAVDQSVSALEACGLPFVIVACEKIRRPVPCVFVDKYGSGYQAAQHLLAASHRDITFLAPIQADWIDARVDGARDAILQAGLGEQAFRRYPANPIELPANVYAECGSLVYAEAGYDAALKLLAVTPLPSAIIAANDQTAFGVYRAAEALGLTVGADFALVGFDDHREARFHGLTTLRPPLDAMGREAGRLLLDALQDKGCCCCAQVRLCPQLVVRSSTNQ